MRISKNRTMANINYKKTILISVSIASFLSSNSMCETVQISVPSGTSFVNISDKAGSSGTGVNKNGSGTLIVGSATYTGETIISEGGLFSITSLGTNGKNITINDGALLGGPGTFLGTIINNGILSPSAGGVEAILDDNPINISIGATSTINGNYTQNANGSVIIYTTPSVNDFLAINGSATFLNSFVFVTPSSASYQSGSSYNRAITWNTLNGDYPLVVATNINASVHSEFDSGGISISLVPFDRNNLSSGISNISFITDVGSSSYIIPSGVNFSNTSKDAQTVTVPINFSDTSKITGIPGSTTVLQGTISLNAGNTLSLVGGGSTVISADNSSTFKGNVSIVGSTLTITGGGNLGTGQLAFSGSGTTLNLGSSAGDKVTLSNTLALNDSSSIPVVIIPPGASATFAGPFTGGGSITFNGSGTVNLIADSQEYTGTLDATTGNLKINAYFSNTPVLLRTNATLSGSGTVNNVTQNGATIQPGNSIGTLNINGNYTASIESGSNTYVVEINNQGNSNLIDVVGSATISDHYTVTLLMDSGTFASNTTIDYTILKAAGGITISSGTTFALNYVKSDQNDNTKNIESINLGLDSADHTKLVLQLTVGSSGFTVANDETSSSTLVPYSSGSLINDVTISENDVTSDNSNPSPSTTTNVIRLRCNMCYRLL